MGVLDRLRRRTGDTGSAERDAPDLTPVDVIGPASESSPSDRLDSIGEQRGDFMMLPPLRPTFGLPVPLQHSPSEYMVTRRPMAVTNEPLSHGVSPEQLGMVTGRARRARGRIRPRRSELLHRLPESNDDFEELDVAQDLPPVPAPRRLSASLKPTLPKPTLPKPTSPKPTSLKLTPPIASADSAPDTSRMPTPVLPTISEVRRAVTGSTVPAMNTEASTAPDGSFAPPTLPPSALTEASANAPVLRRRASRGRVTTPIEPIDDDIANDIANEIVTPSSDEPVRPPLTMRPSSDPDMPGAPTADSMPPLTGGTRVRGAVPPSLTPATSDQRPTLPDSAPIGSAHSDSNDDTAAAPDLPELINRSRAAADSPTTPRESGAVTPPPSSSPEASAAAGSPVLPSSAPATASRPAEASTPEPISAAPSRAEGASTTEVSVAAGDGDIATAPSAAALPSAPRSGGSRPTLGSRGSIVSPGTTGIQRRARDGGAPAPIPMAMPASRSTSGTTTSSPGGSPETSGAASPSVAGSSSASAPAARAVPTSPAGPTPTIGRRGSTPAGDSTVPEADSDETSGESAEEQAPTPKSIPVPENVRRAVAKAVGDVPDTVLVHEGDHAETMTRQMNAEAFTRDGQVYLAGDAPLSSARGQELLAHELTHVVQQRGGTEQMPDESTAAGRDHESAALQVERAIANESSASEPIELAHATSAASATSAPGEPSGAAPVNVPQGVQRRGREYSINADMSDDDDDSSAPAAIARPNLPAAAPTRPDLVHLQKQQGKFEEVTARNSNSTLTPRSLRPGSSASLSGEYGHDATAPARVNEGRASMSSITGGTHFEGEDQRNTAGKPHLSSAGSEVKESSSMFSKGLSMFEKLTLPPADPFDTDDIDDRRADLERQAHSIYPFIRAKLRAELVKDRERRGRLAREWG